MAATEQVGDGARKDPSTPPLAGIPLWCEVCGPSSTTNLVSLLIGFLYNQSCSKKENLGKAYFTYEIRAVEYATFLFCIKASQIELYNPLFQFIKLKRFLILRQLWSSSFCC